MKTSEENSKVKKKSTKEKTHTLSPSNFQIFFWKIAGSEIAILENCPTDWNKHVGIGMAIFMTTLLAFFSGTYAAYFFTDSVIASCFFGVLWSALIYSIDRSLVVTLKKTPTKKWYSYLLPFIIRGALAIVIAFVISIPLELLIFNENIEIHMGPYKTNKVIEFKELEKKSQEIDTLNKIVNVTNKELISVQTELKLKEPINDFNYDKLKKDSSDRYKDLKKYIKATETQLKKYNGLPKDINGKTIDNNNIYSEYKKALGKENDFISKKIDPIIDSLDNYRINWKKTLHVNEQIISQNLANDKQNLRNGNNAIIIKSNYQDSILENKKGFVLKFMILEDLASGKSTEANPEGLTMWILLWLIRFIFILVELLPTIVKTATPIGNYDLALWSEEQNFAKSLSDGEQEYREHQTNLRRLEQETLEKQAKDRNTIQEELNKSLLKEIAAAQDAVARQKINEYKEKHIRKQN